MDGWMDREKVGSWIWPLLLAPFPLQQKGMNRLKIIPRRYRRSVLCKPKCPLGISRVSSKDHLPQSTAITINLS
jgi:hypothetical protein